MYLGFAIFYLSTISILVPSLEVSGFTSNEAPSIKPSTRFLLTKAKQNHKQFQIVEQHFSQETNKVQGLYSFQGSPFFQRPHPLETTELFQPPPSSPTPPPSSPTPPPVAEGSQAFPASPSQGPCPFGAAAPGFMWAQIPIQPLSMPQPATNPPPGPANPPNLPPTYTPPVPQPFYTTPNPLIAIEAEDLISKCMKDRGQFPTNICNKYINCWDGVAVEQFCPEGLLFSFQGYCDDPQRVDCAGRPILAIPPKSNTTETNGEGSSQSSSEPTPPTTVAPPTNIVTFQSVDPELRKKCLKSRGQFPSDSCNKFVNCWDDIVVEEECPQGLLFSVKGYCDYAQNVNCQDNEQKLPSRVDGVERCPLPYGTFRDKHNCSNYYTCVDGNVVAQYTCPLEFRFNDNLGVCDYMYRVDCSKPPQIFHPKHNFLHNIPKDIMSKIESCKPGTVFPLNQHCTIACLCRDGLAEIVQCPTGLSYDSKANKCLLPELAKC